MIINIKLVFESVKAWALKGQDFFFSKPLLVFSVVVFVLYGFSCVILLVLSKQSFISRIYPKHQYWHAVIALALIWVSTVISSFAIGLGSYWGLKAFLYRYPETELIIQGLTASEELMDLVWALLSKPSDYQSEAQQEILASWIKYLSLLKDLDLSTPWALYMLELAKTVQQDQNTLIGNNLEACHVYTDIAISNIVLNVDLVVELEAASRLTSADADFFYSSSANLSKGWLALIRDHSTVIKGKEEYKFCCDTLEGVISKCYRNHT